MGSHSWWVDLPFKKSALLQPAISYSHAAAAAGAPPGSSSAHILFSDLANVDYSIAKMLFDGLPPIAEAESPPSDAVSTISEMVTTFKLPASQIAHTLQQRPALDVTIPTCGVHSSGQANRQARRNPARGWCRLWEEN